MYDAMRSQQKIALQGEKDGHARRSKGVWSKLPKERIHNASKADLEVRNSNLLVQYQTSRRNLPLARPAQTRKRC